MKKLLKRALRLEYSDSAYVFTLFGRKLEKSSIRVANKFIRKQNDELKRKIESLETRPIEYAEKIERRGASIVPTTQAQKEVPQDFLRMEEQIKALSKEHAALDEALVGLGKRLDSFFVTQTSQMRMAYQQRHEDKLGKLHYKVKNGNKIRVFFINTSVSKFPEKSVYEAMLGSSLFEPHIFVLAQNGNRSETARSNFHVFRERGYNAILGYDDEDNIIRLEEHGPDLVFYNELPSSGPYRTDLLNYKYLTCHMHYGVGSINKDTYHVEAIKKTQAWIYFIGNTDILNRMLASKYTSYNGVYLGYPKLDAYAQDIENDSLPEKLSGKPYVIYAPHWSIGISNNLATFHLHYRYFFSLMEQHPDIGFVFKPHSVLEDRILKIEKTADLNIGVTHAEYMKYFEDWNNMPNGHCVTDGEFVSLFKNARCLITDSGSFVSEWLPSGNPCIYIVNPELGEAGLYRKFRPHAQRCLDTYYLAETQDEIQSLFEKVVIDGIDGKKGDRIKLSEELFPNLGHAGEDIVDYITKKIRGGVLMMVIGYTSGVYDLFHIGHLALLRNAKALCDKLIVGVTVDELVSYKGKAAVIPYPDRAEIVRNIKYVDAVVPQHDMDKLAMCQKLGASVMFVGDDWYGTEKWAEYERQLAEAGIRIVYFPYTKGVSSTMLSDLLQGHLVTESRL